MLRFCGQLLLRLPGFIQRKIAGSHGSPQGRQLRIQLFACEAMPGLGQFRDLFFGHVQSAARVDSLALRRCQHGVALLPQRELLPIRLNEIGATLTLAVLLLEVRSERDQDCIAGTPQSPQLIENQSRIALLTLFETRFSALKNFLHACRGAFLLAQPFLERVNFILQLEIGFLELRPIAKQLEHALILGPVCRVTEPAKTKLVQYIHCQSPWRRPAQPGVDQRLAETLGWKRWPRSTQYSSHLFSIMLRAQR